MKRDKKGMDQLMKASYTAHRVSSDDKMGQHFIDYVVEYSSVCNDGHRKKQADVDRERSFALACDRLLQQTDEMWDKQMNSSIQRQNEVLESLPEEFIENATSLNAQPFPLNVSKPKLTPPLSGYEPAYGMDVPQLRAEIPQYPNPSPAKDQMEAGDESSVRNFTVKKLRAWRDALGRVRKAYPYTGPEGEQFELYCALNMRSLQRQLLILDMSDDPTLRSQMENADFSAAERERRGIQGITVSEERNVLKDGAPTLHAAQSPLYHPFRYV